MTHPDPSTIARGIAQYKWADGLSRFVGIVTMFATWFALGALGLADGGWQLLAVAVCGVIAGSLASRRVFRWALRP